MKSRATNCRGNRGRLGVFLCLLGLALGGASPARGQLQFDVLPGYDGIVPEASWFPVVFEVLNDGPTFTARIEITAGLSGGSQSRFVALELPTHTRKRLTLPLFAGLGRYSSWDFRLLDERGRVRAEKLNFRPKREIAAETFLLGAVPRSLTGLPGFPNVPANRADLQPVVARLQPELFPDHPITLEGLDALYLSSEKAVELKPAQVAALLAWVHGGGHLIVGVEQPSDVNATPWLRSLLPCDLAGVTTVKQQGEIFAWLKSPSARDTETNPAAARATSPDTARRTSKKTSRAAPASYTDPFTTLAGDDSFDEAEIPLTVATLREGRVLAGANERPLVLQARRLRGQVTVLAFSPEREPFLSWKNRAWFWAKLTELPPSTWASSDFNRGYRQSLDGVFGALIETKQVRKLPVVWLLVLLGVYLLVIGPVDRRTLQRAGRPMLTWLTFPCYVALFSGLVYFIGYKLHAGESEWNELHLVDVLPRGDAAELRGRTFASLYSPANNSYPLAAEKNSAATLRGEMRAGAPGLQEGLRSQIEQRGNAFLANVVVPVWTSQLFVEDWWQPAPMPLTLAVISRSPRLEVEIENRLPRKLTGARLVVGERVHLLGELPEQQKKKFTLDDAGAVSLRDFVQPQARQLSEAAQRRHSTFGSSGPETEIDRLQGAMAASFCSRFDYTSQRQFDYLAPAGLDLVPLVEKGDAVLLAWDAGHSFTAPLNQFNPRRAARDTLLRVTVPVKTTP